MIDWEMGNTPLALEQLQIFITTVQIIANNKETVVYTKRKTLTRLTVVPQVETLEIIFIMIKYQLKCRLNYN
jgi:hypothetical protein